MTETTEGRPARTLPPTFGPRPGHLRREEMDRQIYALVGRLTFRLRGLDFSLPDGGTAEMERLNGTLKLMLSSDQPAARKAAAEMIAGHLLDVGESADPTFWATDLGRAIAREIGYVTPFPTRLIAGAVLHVSRQAVAQMISRGALDKDPVEGGPFVGRDSLQRAAAQRWPFGTDA